MKSREILIVGICLTLSSCRLLKRQSLPTELKTNTGEADDGPRSKTASKLFVPGELLLKTKKTKAINLDVKSLQEGKFGPASLDSLNLTFKVLEIKPLFDQKGKTVRTAARKKKTSMSGIFLVTMPAATDVISAAERYSKHPDVEYAEPNYIFSLNATAPNDPFLQSRSSWGQDYDDLWGIKLVKAPAAWATSQGEGIVVAVVDSGMDELNPDLAPNMWINNAEIADNQMDDDSNGFVDDTHGWNFIDDNNVVSDEHGHGSHVAGTIAAVGNNGLGVIGVAPKAKIMPLKCFNAEGNSATSDLAAAVRYAADNHAKIANHSWGGRVRSQTLEESFDYAKDKGLISFAAAGNDRRDAKNFSPAAYASVITVGAVNQDRYRAAFTNYGAVVDISAPGGGQSSDATDLAGERNILSLVPDNSTIGKDFAAEKVAAGYYRLAGTSMATPHAAGVGALILAKRPTLNFDGLLELMKTSSDPIYSDVALGAGIPNAERALDAKFSGTPVRFPALPFVPTVSALDFFMYYDRGNPSAVVTLEAENGLTLSLVISNSITCSPSLTRFEFRHTQKNPARFELALAEFQPEGTYYFCLNYKDALGASHAAKNSPMTTVLATKNPAPTPTPTVYYQPTLKNFRVTNFRITNSLEDKAFVSRIAAEWQSATPDEYSVAYKVSVADNIPCNHPVFSKTVHALNISEVVNVPLIPAVYFLCVFAVYDSGPLHPAEEIVSETLSGASWTNPRLVLDVDDNLVISPMDALIISNELVANGAHALTAMPDGRYLDTNHDGFVTPLDVLPIANCLHAENCKKDYQ